MYNTYLYKFKNNVPKLEYKYLNNLITTGTINSCSCFSKNKQN